MIGSVSDVFLLNAYRDALNWRAWGISLSTLAICELGFSFCLKRDLAIS